jgi:thioredoxin 1
MTKKQSFSELINGDSPVLVDFTATWCGPCKAMAPVLEKVKKNIGDTAKIIKVDIDKNQQFAAKMGVSGVPTFVLFKNGAEKWRQVGMVSEHQLVKVLQEFA